MNPGDYPSDYHEEWKQSLAPGVAGRLGLSRELIRGAGLAFASYAIVWGVWIACPWFDVFTSPIFEHYRQYPEWLWGCYSLTAGLCQFVGFARHYSLLSFVGAVLLIAFFLFGAWNFLAADWRSPGTPLFLMFLAWHLLIADTKGRSEPNVVQLAAKALPSVVAVAPAQIQTQIQKRLRWGRDQQDKREKQDLCHQREQEAFGRSADGGDTNAFHG